MKKITTLLILTFILLSVSASAARNKKSTDVEVTVTFLVMMDRNADANISKALKSQNGIISSKINTKKQEVVITFDGRKNRVSNLQNMFKEAGYTAQAVETGCFGSPEGCLNAVHHTTNTMP